MGVFVFTTITDENLPDATQAQNLLTDKSCIPFTQQMTMKNRNHYAKRLTLVRCSPQKLKTGKADIMQLKADQINPTSHFFWGLGISLVRKQVNTHNTTSSLDIRNKNCSIFSL